MVHDSWRTREVTSWMGSRARVVVTDGRILIGTLECIDKDRNVLLSACDVYRVRKRGEADEEEEKRLLGLACIARKHLVSLEMAAFPSRPLAQEPDE